MGPGLEGMARAWSGVASAPSKPPDEPPSEEGACFCRRATVLMTSSVGSRFVLTCHAAEC